jgi:RNA polymerase sigma-70 factor (ECF subfamily)
LHRRALQRLGEYRAYADDVVQETWIRCHRFLDSFERGSAFTTWLIRIADNQCNTLIRKQMTYTDQEDVTEQLEQSIYEEEQLAKAGDIAEPVSDTLEKLPDAMQDILTLRYERNLPLQSISDLLGITLSAAKMRLYRAQTQFEAYYRQSYNVADFNLMQAAS